MFLLFTPFPWNFKRFSSSLGFLFLNLGSVKAGNGSREYQVWGPNWMSGGQKLCSNLNNRFSHETRLAAKRAIPEVEKKVQYSFSYLKIKNIFFRNIFCLITDIFWEMFKRKSGASSKKVYLESVSFVLNNLKYEVVLFKMMTNQK